LPIEQALPFLLVRGEQPLRKLAGCQVVNGSSSNGSTRISRVSARTSRR
jgi:hypothetical protein